LCVFRRSRDRFVGLCARAPCSGACGDWLVASAPDHWCGPTHNSAAYSPADRSILSSLGILNGSLNWELGSDGWRLAGAPGLERCKQACRALGACAEMTVNGLACFFGRTHCVGHTRTSDVKYLAEPPCPPSPPPPPTSVVLHHRRAQGHASPPATVATVRVAIIGSYGSDTATEAKVAELVRTWVPDLVMTTGNNRLGKPYEEAVGKHYGAFLYQYPPAVRRRSVDRSPLKCMQTCLLVLSGLGPVIAS